jgi:hypothetical protein
MTRSLFSRFLPTVLSVAALSSAASAHVQAFRYCGHLLVFGNNQAESVTITGTSNNLFVIGNHGTLVNGQASASFANVHGSVLVDLGGGHDGVAVADCDLDGHLVLLMGSGNDTAFVARNTIAGSVLVESGLFGTYEDLVVMNDPFDGGNLIGGDVLVVGRRVTALLRAQEILGSTLVWTGSGNDLVTLAASNFHGNVRVDTEGGGDHVAIGDAADVVQNLFGGRLDVRLGSGNDRLTVRRSTVEGQARLLGESGSDVVESAAPAYGNVFQATLQFTGFESVL